MRKTWIASQVRCAAHRWPVVLVVLIAASVFASEPACADDWGCQVFLCLSNPGGPEQYVECVPPVEKLWSALRHGDPFPACESGAGGSGGSGGSGGAGDSGDTSGFSVSKTFASAAYCREDLLYWGGREKSELLCGARGAINVDIGGRLQTRVWWDAGGQSRTITEYYGAGSTQRPYDPMQAAHLFLERMEQEEGSDIGGGG
ncbi:hypothetical protein [Paraburkholderia sp. BL10I2N1]|uniref:hypothetical protein n=1 Tax=Paraburkholderia sp. BL10I2N1 TaxID=1938796 RepID=UPI00105ECF8D|nr:hypothetical protein [Paraburkholderia sp. BL10I2N1]TDN67178.1 hypothetical protein B0G77_0424 [Paraburkholderia sp. BL10I2N1]